MISEANFPTVPSVVARPTFRDSRGSSFRVGWSRADHVAHHDTYALVVSNAISGTVRGLHYSSEGTHERKEVSVVSGSIFDLCIDLRALERGTLRVYHRTSKAEDDETLLIPSHFAHGYQTLEPGTTLIYRISGDYDVAAQQGMSPLSIPISNMWPKEIAIVSERDRNLPVLRSTNARETLDFRALV